MNMRISDLTKDTRPSLEEMLIESIHDTIDVDMVKPNDRTSEVEYENYSFYYRVIFLFMQRAVNYYDNIEISEWSRKELLKETILPKIEEIRNSGL